MDRFKTAQDALADAKAKVDSKDYKGARMAAKKAIAFADSAKTEAAVGKETAKLDAEKKLEELKTMWSDVNAALGKVPGKVGQDLRKEAAAAADTINKLPEMMAKGEYAEVLKGIENAMAKGNGLKARAMEEDGRDAQKCK